MRFGHDPLERRRVVENGLADDGKHQAELKKLNPCADGCPPDVRQRQAEQYGRLFQLLLKHADAVERVTFWGLHDGRSWLNDWPWKQTDYGLIFDRQFQPKPAFFAIAATLGASAPR